MIIIKKGKRDSIDKMLKRYKNKHRAIGVGSEVRERQQYTKKSERRRKVIKQAAFRERRAKELGITE